MRIAAPLVAAYLADVAMLVTAKMVVGKLGFRELAATGLLSDVCYQFTFVAAGLLSVVGVFVAEAYGGRRKEDAVHALVNGLLLATLMGIVLTAVAWKIDVILVLSGQDPALLSVGRPFLDIFALNLLPFMWISVLRVFAAALHRTGMVMIVNGIGVVLNYVLMQGLVHGDFGLPQLGVAGAGVAALAISLFKVAWFAVYTWRLAAGEGLAWRPDSLAGRLRGILAIIRLGLPVAGVVALEVGLFSAVSLMSGMLGAAALASYELIMGWVAIPFVIAAGLGEAGMVRVAYWMGASDPAGARRAGLLALAMGTAVPLLLAIIPLGAPDLVTRAFLSHDDPGFAEVSALVGAVLFIAALFQIFDCLQGVASHILRGMRDTAMPLWIAGIGYWAVGLGLAYVMGFAFDGGVRGLWWGVAAGLVFTGSLLTLRFDWLSRRKVGAKAAVSAGTW